MAEAFNSSIHDYRVPKSIPTSSSSGSCTSSQASLDSNGSATKKRRSGGAGSDRRKPRSPSERKIGIVRRRSQEMARKGSLAQQVHSQHLNTGQVLYSNGKSVFSFLFLNIGPRFLKGQKYVLNSFRAVLNYPFEVRTFLSGF